MEKNKTLVDQTTEAIIDYIHEHHIEPGEKLPNEYSLANELQVGRSTFREAIRILVSRNILEVHQGSGTFISEKRGQSADPFGMTMIRDKQKMISDLYDMRYVLEPEVAMLAATHASAAEVDQMAELVAAIEQSFEDGNDAHVKLDIQLHSLIGKASGNLAYSYILPIINQSISLFNASYNIANAKHFTKRIHRRLLHAMQTHNPQEARDAMLVHMANNRMVFQEVLQTNGGPNGKHSDE